VISAAHPLRMNRAGICIESGAMQKPASFWPVVIVVPRRAAVCFSAPEVGAAGGR